MGVNKGNKMDFFVWCRLCRASLVIFWVNNNILEKFVGFLDVISPTGYPWMSHLGDARRLSLGVINPDTKYIISHGK